MNTRRTFFHSVRQWREALLRTLAMVRYVEFTTGTNRPAADGDLAA